MNLQTEAPSLPADAAPDDGVLRGRDLTKQGVSRQRVQRLIAQGELIRIGRGLYARPDATMTENHTLAQVGARVPQGVICLASALQFHQLTTQNPWQVWLLIERHARAPHLDYPPLRVLRAGGEAFTEGVEEHILEGVVVRVTSAAKTVADCFKYRSKIGLDVALEALRDCLSHRCADRATLHHFARVCRVERVMQPYMEALSL